MASVGLLDWDLIRWQQPTVFNLELMKLSTHLKGQRMITKMLDRYDDSRYSKIIVRKDYEDDDYPSDIFNNPKTESGGLVFTNGLYTPMAPEIESCLPDKSIYTNMARFYSCDEISKCNYKSMMSGAHIRLNNDDWERQFIEQRAENIRLRTLLIHDQQLEKSSHFQDVVNFFLDKVPMGVVGWKFPISIHNESEFAFCGTVPKVRGMSDLKFHYLPSDESLYEAVEAGKRIRGEYLLSAEDILSNSNQIFLQIVFLGGRISRILLNPIEEKSISSEWENVIKLMNGYSSFIEFYQTPLTMYNYAARFSKWLKVDLINTFNFLRENDYPLFKLFYECSAVRLHNGSFESRWSWKSNGGTII